MKLYLLCFASTFLLGYAISFPYGNASKLPESAATTDAVRTSAGHDNNDAASEYATVMLSEEEQLTLLVDQANTLNALLGAAEKIYDSNDLGQYSLQPIITKLARLYPAEALRYYRTRPTNVEMNQLMEREIMQQWGRHDLHACLANLDQNQNLSLDEFSDLWCELVDDNFPEKTKEFVQAFAKLSREKQRKLIDDGHYISSLLPHLLAEIKEPDLLAEAQEQVNQSMEQAANSESEPKKKSEYDIERERVKTVIKQLEEANLEPEEFAKFLREEKSEDARRTILLAMLSQREEEKDKVSPWLNRMSKVLEVIDEILPYPPGSKFNGVYEHQEELEQWLPTQSPRVQRAWADDLVRDRPKEQALEWIEQLSTASLRNDMREHVITNWTQNNPNEAAEYLLNKASSDDQESYLPDAIYNWALRDFASATHWLENTPDSPAKTAALQKLQHK